MKETVDAVAPMLDEAKRNLGALVDNVLGLDRLKRLGEAQQ